MVLRLLAGCVVIGTLFWMSPERGGAGLPAIPAGVTNAAVQAVAREMLSGQAGIPPQLDRGALSQALLQGLVSEGVRAGGALATAQAGPRDTLTAADRKPPWRSPGPHS
jgi:hypothetical protein